MTFALRWRKTIVGGEVPQSLPHNLSPAEFGILVEEALSTLPKEILAHMDNVAVIVAEWPSGDELRRAKVGSQTSLYGLYEGIPLTRRGTRYGLVPPDRITLYRGPLLMACRTVDALREQVRRTVVHEIAHHFGISEARIQHLGY